MATDEVTAPAAFRRFPGARPYRESEDLLFFGRADEAAAVAEHWQTEPLTVLYGPAGIGKSSLLRAGVLPLLWAQASTVLPVGLAARGPAFPDAADPSSNPFARTLVRTWTPGTSLPPPVRRFLRSVEQTGEQTKAPVLLAVDQAEDMFRGDRGDERRELLSMLLAARGTHLLLCVRDDRFGALLGELHRFTSEVAEFALDGLTPCAAIDALSRPLAGTSRSIIAAAAEQLVEELTQVRLVDESGNRTEMGRLAKVIPWHLQAVCAYISRAWPQGERVLTTDRLPNVTDVLHDAVWRAVAEIAASFDRDPSRLARWLAATFVLPTGAARAVPAGPASAEGMPNSVLDALVDRALLRIRPTDGARAYIAHSDRLLEPFGRLAQRAGVLDPPLLTPAGRLRAAADACSDGDYPRAERLAREVAAARPDPLLRIEAHTVMGNIAFARGELSAAQDAYQWAVTLLETRNDQAAVGTMLAAIGQLVLKRGDPAEALGILRSAAARLPGDRTVRTELARALADAGEPAAAAAILSR